MCKITEEMAKKLVGAESVEIKETGIFNDLKLSKSERIEHANMYAHRFHWQLR